MLFQVIKRSVRNTEPSGPNAFLPVQITDGYLCEVHHTEDKETTVDDREVAEIIKCNVDEDSYFKLAGEAWTNDTTQEMDFDDREDDENSARESSEYQSTDVQYSRDEVESVDEDGNTNGLSIEALRDKVLNNSESHKRVHDADKSKEEKFAELLEDFLAENEDLPPEIRDDIWDMLTDVSKTVQEEKARQATDSLTEYSSDRNDDGLVGGSERQADSDLMLDVARQTPVYGDSERPVDKYLVQKVARTISYDREFQASADAGLTLLARKEMPSNIEYENAVEEVLMQQANTSDSRENVNPIDTDLLMVAARGIPPKIESNSSSDTDVVVIKGKKISAQIESTAFGITETKPKFGSIMDVSVEMDNTGEAIYNEIAAFFGCKYFSFLF